MLPIRVFVKNLCFPNVATTSPYMLLVKRTLGVVVTVVESICGHCSLLSVLLSVVVPVCVAAHFRLILGRCSLVLVGLNPLNTRFLTRNPDNSHSPLYLIACVLPLCWVPFPCSFPLTLVLYWLAFTFSPFKAKTCVPSAMGYQAG